MILNEGYNLYYTRSYDINCFNYYFYLSYAVALALAAAIAAAAAAAAAPDLGK